jgi:RelA/SpoT family (p)ppGpp synthetase
MVENSQKIINHLINKSTNPDLIRTAFDFAKNAYKERFRFTGENYIEHAVRTADLLDKMNLDSTTIAFAILHNIIGDTPDLIKEAELKEIEHKFGKEMALMLDKISNLKKIRFPLSTLIKEKNHLTSEKIENLRKMFLAMSGDLRVILVEIVSRLDGLNYLKFLPEDFRKIQAWETLQIFVPIASRLGLAEIRRNLEDTSFYNLLPTQYVWVEKALKEKYDEGGKYFTKFIPNLKKILKKNHGAFININYRLKSYWSTYKKLLKKNMDISKVHDLLALRIITSDISSCYKILGILHKHFKPITGEINDYIAKPKINGYRSLHTTLISDEGIIIEIQIRTEEMQKEAEYGICAHWAYKEKIDLNKNKSALAWTENIPSFWDNFKIDFYSNKVFCFTPRGDIIILPKDGTPIDFAYAVHSEIGNHCESAKVNGKIVQLNYSLKNGDIVEIKTNKNKYPSADWLRFVKTSFAKGNIKKYTEKEKSIFSFALPGFIRKKIIEITEAKKEKQKKQESVKSNVSQIYLAGQKGMLIRIAKCCNPKQGDKVRAYLAPGRATILHKTTCGIFKEIYKKYPEKIIEATWE